MDSKHPTDQVTIAAKLADAEAMALAQFLKRSTFSDYRSHAIDETETYRMIAACERLREALAEAGYAPR